MKKVICMVRWYEKGEGINLHLTTENITRLFKAALRLHHKPDYDVKVVFISKFAK